jgi:predicted metal-dependent hydrolase
VSRYLKGYNPETVQQAEAMLDANKVGTWLLGRYPTRHSFASERALYDFTQALKNQYMKSSNPISKVCYDDKIHVIDNALGLHKFVSRVQGNKLKAKNEIKISSLFRAVPEPFLRMIVVHELSHLREKSHDKAFYKLCNYMEPDYHQLEFEVRLYLAHKERYGELWS